MESLETCPQCAGTITDGGMCRLVVDNCGHRKCRMCIWKDANCCQQCTVNKAITTEIPQQKPDQLDEPINTIPPHILKDQNFVNYTCTICKQDALQEAQIKYHLNCVEKKKAFHCKVCNKDFVLKSHFNSHQLIHQNAKPYHCTDCGKNFREKSKLKRHRLSHTTARPFVCGDCGKTFKIHENLRTHLLIHKKEKPYACSECSLRFSHSSNLKKHLTVHTTDKPHMCDQCGKRFKLKWTLTLHWRVHTPQRLNKCALCAKTFAHRKDLVRHELIHADNKKFRCGICSMTFKRKDNLCRHSRNTHPDKEAQIITCVDNPNAINVITVPQSLAEPIEKVEDNNNMPEPMPLPEPTCTTTNKQTINAPPKLAFKTPLFKNHYNIYRDVNVSQGDGVSIYEKILMPRSPAIRTTTIQPTPTPVAPTDITLPGVVAPHYETSFDNRKHAIIKNIKFKLPPKYIFTETTPSEVPPEPSKETQPEKGTACSVIVNSCYDKTQDVHWRKRNNI